MENSFNLEYQKQLFVIIQQAVEFKKSIIKESGILVNGGKEKKLDSFTAIIKMIKKKLEKTPDPNLSEILLLLKSVDEAVLKLEERLELKNDFANEVFETEIALEEAKSQSDLSMEQKGL